MSPADVDFDLHGVVRVRLVDADARDAAAVGAQLGSPPAAPDPAAPEVVVRFVPRLATPGLRFVEVGRSGFTDDGFYVLWHRKRRVCVRLPLDRAGGPFELVCEHGLRSVPLLDALLKVAALEKGVVPVHASAFEHGGAGVLVAGWAHGGKTSALLAFARAGAAFVSDDVVLLGEDGRLMGIPTPLSVSDWQLEQLPGGWSRLPLSRRLVFAGVRGLDALERRGGAGAGLVRDALPALRRRLKVELPPEAVFGRVAGRAPELGTVFLALSHPGGEIRVDPADPAGVAERLAASLRHELLPLSEQYLAYRFAFPAAAPDPLPELLDRAGLLLRRALEGRDAFVVSHPHPVLLWDLYEAMHPHVARPAPARLEVPA